MRAELARLVEYVLRGYGQLFLANRVTSGACFACGLFLVSPIMGVLSLIGAVTLTATARARLTPESLLKTGLFGINGVLVGCAWSLFPEIDGWIQVVATVAIGIVLGLVLPPAVAFLRDRPVSLFTIPYVIAIWGTLLLLVGGGRYDLRFTAGWSALASDPARAERVFAMARASSTNAEAYRQDGLGWAAFKQREDGRAREHFASAVSLRSDLADAHDGFGWCALRLGDLDAAESAFRSAIELDSRLGDVWDGLGWVLRERGHKDEARGCFLRAILATPLASDPYVGINRTLAEPSRICEVVAEWSAAHVASRLQWTPTAQIVCWLLVFLGLSLHSRTSTILALTTVVALIAVARIWPDRAASIADPRLLCNLLPLVLALGGHYLTLDRLTAAWIVVASLGMIALWPALAATFDAIGLPILCFPFNLCFVASLLLFAALRRFGWENRLVPMDQAVTSPEEVRCWQKRSAIARACWDRILQANASPQPLEMTLNALANAVGVPASASTFCLRENQETKGTG